MAQVAIYADTNVWYIFALSNILGQEDNIAMRSIFASVLIIGSCVALALTGCGSGTASTEDTHAGRSKSGGAGISDGLVEGSGKGMAAIRQAATADKYLFMFFSKADDDQTLAMRKVFDAAMEKVADRAQWVAVNANDPAEKAIVAKFDLARAPMPLVLAMAPNGAITGGFPTKFEEQQLLKAFATPVTEKVMKHLQDNRLVFRVRPEWQDEIERRGNAGRPRLQGG